MRQGSSIYPWFLRFSSLYVISFNIQYKYEEQTNFLMKIKPIVYYKVFDNFTLTCCKDLKFHYH